MLLPVIYQQVAFKIRKAFMYFFYRYLCLLVSLSSISLLITIVIFHDAPAFVVKLDLLYIQNLHLSILSSVGRVIVCFFCIYSD